MNRLTVLLLLAFVLTSAGRPAGAAIVTQPPPSGTNLAADAEEDMECAAITQTRNGFDYTVVAYMKFHPLVASKNSTITVVTAFSGGTTVATLPTVSGYDIYADPVLARDDVVSARPIYLAGVAKNSSTQATAIVVWSTTDAGFTWSAPVVVDAGDRSISLDVDKPAIGVAPSGRVYLAYVRAGTDVTNTPGQRQVGENQISVAWSPYGGLSWTTGAEVSAATLPAMPPEPSKNHAPQVMADSDGTVYVVWMRYGSNGGIHMKKTSSVTPLVFSGTELTQIYTLPGNSMLDPGATITIHNDPSQINRRFLKAATCPAAKLDPIRRLITVTWHESSGLGAKVRVATNLIGRPAWFYDNTVTPDGGLAVQPSLDFDNSGNLFLTYYQFTDISQSVVNYTQYATYVTFLFGTLSHEQASTYGAVSNVLTGTVNDFAGHRELGEYHDVSCNRNNNVCSSVGIQIVNGASDPYLWNLVHQ